MLDLHELDYLQEAHQMDSIKIAIFARQLSYKDSIIYKQEQQLVLFDSMQNTYVVREKLFVEEQKNLQRKIKRMRGQRNIISLSGIAAIILLLL